MSEEKKPYVIIKTNCMTPYAEGRVFSIIELTDEEYKLYQNKCFYLSRNATIHYSINPLDSNNTEKFESLVVPSKVCIYATSRMYISDLYKLGNYVSEYWILRNALEVKDKLTEISFHDPLIERRFDYNTKITDELIESNKILWMINNYNSIRYPNLYLDLFLFGVNLDINEDPEDFNKRIKDMISSKIKYVLDNEDNADESDACLLIDGGEV